MKAFCDTTIEFVMVFKIVLYTQSYEMNGNKQNEPNILAIKNTFRAVKKTGRYFLYTTLFLQSRPHDRNSAGSEAQLCTRNRVLWKLQCINLQCI